MIVYRFASNEPLILCKSINQVFIVLGVYNFKSSTTKLPLHKCWKSLARNRPAGAGKGQVECDHYQTTDTWQGVGSSSLG